MSLVSVAFCRRALLRATARASLSLAGVAFAAPVFGEPGGSKPEDNEIIRRLTGRDATAVTPCPA